ncbi:MAG: prolyl oligopeptidase family serine peptidase, partial [Bacteroidales bacterium]|nr:prolyl oligopeptidase family serine peptidase [Bacteroidales bacterium]
VHAMLKYPDIYKAGLAVAGVYSVYLYDTAYQERYMGLPQKNKVGYDSGSSIYWTTRLKGPLMLIHGTGDDNVHYQCMEQLVDALVRDGKVFDMMSYPMRTHSVSERANTTPHLYNTMLNFWKNNL